MSTSLKIVNEEGDFRIEGSILFNGKTPVLGMDLLERPLYGNEIDSAINTHFVEENRTVGSDGKLYRDEKVISDHAIDISEMNYYMKNYEIEKTLYSSSKMVVDILNDQIVVDLIEPDQYTSSIDLQRVEKKMIQPGLSAKVDLSVKYTKGTSICAKDLTFEAFSYDDTTLKRNDFISRFDSDVIVEYVDGVVRVIPIVIDVTECIISNCVVTYVCQQD